MSFDALKRCMMNDLRNNHSCGGRFALLRVMGYTHGYEDEEPNAVPKPASQRFSESSWLEVRSIVHTLR